MHRRVQRRRFLASAAVGGLVLASTTALKCGRSSSRPTASQRGTPRSGGKVSIRITNDLTDFDPTTTPKTQLTQTSIAYDRLLGFKRGPGIPYNQLTLQPEIAERWETPDPTTFIFNVRQGAKFANIAPVNGRPFTSADVRWSLEYESRSGSLAGRGLPKAQADWMLDGLQQVETPDAYTAIVHFKQPFVPFINYAGATPLAMLPSEVFDQYGSFKEHPIGTTAYQLDSTASQHGSHWVWKRNPNYWDAGKPYIEEIDCLVLDDDSTTYAAFKAKQIDLLCNTIAFADQQRIRADNPNAVMYPFLDPAAGTILMNVRPGTPLGDERLRQAISFAVDRDEFIKTFEGGNGEWALAGALEDTFTQEEVHQILRHDTAAAKQLLSAAGHSDGIALDSIYPATGFGQGFLLRLQLFQSQLKQAGITLNLKAIDPTDASERRRKGDFVVILQTDRALYADVDSYFYAGFHPKSTSNYGGVNDPELTRLIEAQRQEADPATRKETVKQGVRYIAQHALGLSTYYTQYAQFWTPKLQGYYPSWGDPGADRVPHLQDSWLEL